MPDPDWFVFIVIASAVSFGCLVLYGMFSAAQIAMERASERKIREIYAERLSTQKRALRHMERPQRFLSTVALMRILTIMIASFNMCASISLPLAGAISGGTPGGWSITLAFDMMNE